MLLLVLVGSLSAQTPHKTSRPALPSSATTLTSIKATGSQRYTATEIVAATALELGQNASEDDFKRASQYLGETGAFSDVVYSFQFSSTGTKLEFHVTDSAQFVPARFDNFVWFSDAGLLEKLHSRVPLFRGQLPIAGTLVDQVSDALQALLIENNIQGRADYLRYAPMDGPLQAFIFSVTANTIHIHDTQFTGAAASELPILQTAAKHMNGQNYLRSSLSIQAEKNFLPIYLARGYLKATFSDAQPKVIRSSPEETLVDVTFPVVPGLQYKLSRIQWSGNTVFPADKLQPLIHLAAGQPADVVQLDEDIETAQNLYGTRGYLEVQIKRVPDMDDAQSTVSYILEVHEGAVYTMGDFEIQGLDDHAKARLVELWKLRTGDVYDSSYANRFLQESANSVLPLAQWNVNVHELPDKRTKTVDVTLQFSSRAPN